MAGKWQRGVHSSLVVAQVTDWQLYEVLDPGEMMGMNAYNTKIAWQRMARWVDKVITLPR